MCVLPDEVAGAVDQERVLSIDITSRSMRTACNICIGGEK